MPFVSRRFGFVYFPIPKVGGTSIRDALFRLETGRAFVPAVLASGGATEPWMHFPAIAFRDIPPGAFDGLARLVVVRHPVERLISAFRNRVGHYREVEKVDFARAGIASSVPKDPDFDAFCRYLPEYRRIDAIRHHTQPQSLYLGVDLSYFDHVFRLEQVDDLERHLERLCGTAVELPRLRADGIAKDRITVSQRSREAIRSYYRCDFDLLRRFYR